MTPEQWAHDFLTCIAELSSNALKLKLDELLAELADVKRRADSVKKLADALAAIADLSDLVETSNAYAINRTARAALAELQEPR